MQPSVLVIEDDVTVATAIVQCLRSYGVEVSSVSSAEEATQGKLNAETGLILSDLDLPGMSGLEFLKKLRNQGTQVPFILMSSRADVPVIVEAVRRGAWEVISKPIDFDRLQELLRQLPLQSARDRILVSANPVMKKTLQLSERVARTDTSVLLLGESGSGKELLARKIHQWSARKDEPFIAINCAAIPENLLESEFFGHEPGAFTGAVKQRIGVLELAHTGTLFLDEVGDMPVAFQVKLLRALQVREIRRLGGNQTIKVAPRIIAATNKNPQALMNAKLWREDFYFRIAVVSLIIPPLRERLEDITQIASSIAQDASIRLGYPVKLTESALLKIKQYHWPGNVRELENIIERAAIFSLGNIAAEHLEISVQGEGNGNNLKTLSEKASQEAEREALRKALEQTGYNKSETARILGVSYKTVLNKVREYQLMQS